MRRFFAAFFVTAIAALGQSYTIATIAGSDLSGDGGVATRATLLQAEGVAADAGGNVYIADAAANRIRKMLPNGIIVTIAGTGVAGFAGDGGPAAAAQLNSPYGLALDVSGNLYVADLGNARVRKISPAGIIATVAGGGKLAAGGANDGMAAASLTLDAPRNLALDLYGNLFISDFSGQRVYVLSAFGALTTYAGTGKAGFSGDGSAATLATLNYPAGLAFDFQGRLYIADSQNHCVRRVSNGMISTVEPATTPTGLAFDEFSTLYVADPGAGEILLYPASGTASAWNFPALDLAFNNIGGLYASEGTVVSAISSAGVSSIAAGGGSLAAGDAGPATLARLNHPAGTALDSAGNLYIADRDNCRVRMVAPGGVISTVAGTGACGNTGDGGPAIAATLSSPASVSVDASGNLYVADAGNNRIRKVTAQGTILAFAGTGSVGSSGINGSAVLAQMNGPTGVLAGSDGTVWIADTGNGRILRVMTGGQILAVSQGLASPTGLALDSAGDLFYSESAGPHVTELTPAGALSVLAPGVWNTPRGVAVDSTGAVFVADSGLQQILRIDPESGIAAAIAGTGIAGFIGDGGLATASAVNFPWDISIAAGGVLEVADLANNRIRSLTPLPPASSVTTIAAVNAASLQPGPIAPGMLLEIEGTGIPGNQISAAQIVFGAPAANAISVPVLATNSNGLVVQVPSQIGGYSSISVSVLSQAKTLGMVTEQVSPSAPALFADTTGQALALNQDGTLNSAANPAQRGSTVTLYATGEGVAALPISVTIGGVEASVVYAGAAPGYAGLLQLNVITPSGYFASGQIPVVLTVGQASSQTGVTVSIQ